MTAGIPVPIAIIGMACRLPGNVTNTEELWNLLVEGRVGWSPVPSNRYNEAAFYHPNPENEGTTNHRGGHFISTDIAAFDASFFGISPIEAQAMDPQQRLLLETTYEAFEMAGIPIDGARGSDTAVYTAMFTRDYDRNMSKDPVDLPKYQTTGTGEAILSNRVSYIFDFTGPSMTLDTGCSGSIVALHQACQSLRTGESTMALASGVNLILSPDHMFGMTKLHMLNDAGRSYPFDIRGSGYGRGEGVTTVLLKRVDDALRDGDCIRAIIRNTAVNQDGRTNGITLPDQKTQENLQESIYKNAGLDPGCTHYVEAHGTGTAAGDVAELQAIAKVFGKATNRSNCLHVGSIKSNIGHLESSSGLAGLMKTVLILEQGLIPPNADFQVGKSELNLESWKIKVPVTLEPWPAAGIRQASVNSFGYGGTNAHVILESAPTTIPEERSWMKKCNGNAECDENQIPRSKGVGNTNHRKTQGPLSNEKIAMTGCGDNNERRQASAFAGTLLPQLFVLSAKSKDSVYEVVKRLASWASTRHDIEHYFHNLAYTLSSRRSLMHWRYSIVASSHEELISSLNQKTLRVNKISSYIKIGFIFTGQGAQWSSMGRELIQTHTKFLESLIVSDKILQKLGASWSLINELLLDEKSSRINRSEIAQPASTAFQIALIDLLTSLEIKPQMVMGHSSGEIAAAYAAGILTQATALRISYCRSSITTSCRRAVSTEGAMLAVGLGEDKVLPLLQKLRKGIVDLACVNSPSSTTISGDEPAILEFQNMLNKMSIFNRKLNVKTAYHSHHMREVAHEYLQSLDGLETTAPPKDVVFMSTVDMTKKSLDFGSAYWVHNLVSTVRFSDTLLEYCRLHLEESESTRPSANILIEIGPHSVLAGPIKQTMIQKPEPFEYVYLPTLVRHQNAIQNIMEMAGKLFEHGCSIDLKALNSMINSQHSVRVLQDLPTYPWDHSTTYWHESRMSQDYRFRRHPCHDLLGYRVPGSTSLEPSWRHIISIASLPWLAEHVIDNLVVFPGAGYICMAIEAVRQTVSDGQLLQGYQSFSLKNISFFKALVIPPTPQKIELQLCLRTQRSASMWREFRIYAIGRDGVWHEHCRGLIQMASEPVFIDNSSLNLDNTSMLPEDLIRKTSKGGNAQNLSSERLYSQLRSNGNSYGPCFSAVSELNLGEFQAIAQVVVPNVRSTMPFGHMQPHVIHPTTLDAIMHSSLPLYTQHNGPGAVMPVSINALYVSLQISSTQGQRLRVSTALSPTAFRSAKAEIACFGADVGTGHELVLKVSQVELRGLGTVQKSVLQSSVTRATSYQMEWAPDINYLSLGYLCSLSKHDYLRHLIFKNSELTVLQIGTGASEGMISVLQLLYEYRPVPIKCYDFANISTESFHEAQNILKEWESLMHWNSIDMQQDPTEQGFSEPLYDLIVANNILYMSDNLETTIKHIRKLLKPMGKLIVILNDKNVYTKDHLHNALLKCQFNGIELVLDEHKITGFCETMFVSRPIFPDCKISAVPIEIIAEEEMQNSARGLALALTSNGNKVALKGWGNEISQRETIYVIVDNGKTPLLTKATSERFKQISTLIGQTSNIFWISVHHDASASMNPAKGLVTGLARTAIAENESLNIITFDVQDPMKTWTQEIVHIITDLLVTSFDRAMQSGQAAEREFVYRDSQVLVPRLKPDSKIDNWMTRTASTPTVDLATYGQLESALKLSIKEPGSTNTLSLVDDDSIRGGLDPSAVEIAVKAYGLSRKDLIVALGQTRDPPPMLCEFAGVVKAVGSEATTRFQVGDRVCSWRCDGSLCPTNVRIDSRHAYHLPESITLVIGAAIPFSFLTAYYSIFEIGDLQRGKTIMILGAASGVGQAAIEIALHLEAKVIAIVMSVTEQEDLIKRFKLPDTHVVLGEGMHLYTRALQPTQERGVDLVLSTLSTEFIPDSWACLKPFGVFVQVSQPQDKSNDQIFLPTLGKNAMFVLFDLISLLHVRPHKVAAIMDKVMSIIKLDSYVPAQQVVTFSLENIRNAVNLNQSKKTPEKLILEVTESTQFTNLSAHHAVPQLLANATYVVAGGLGDLGQKICDLLASRGAKYIVILSRRSLGTTERQELQDKLRLVSIEINVYSIACDISRRPAVQEAVSSLENMRLPPVKGVIQSATVLRDCVIERMTAEDFNVPLLTKMYGTQYLSEAFQKLSLDFFVMLSSLSGIVGSRGQANYAAGNTFQDAFAQNQRNSKTHFMALDFGMIEGTTVYSNNEGQTRIQNLLRQGWIPVDLGKFLAVLDYAISPNAREDDCKQVVIGFDEMSLNEAQNAPPTTRSAMFIHVRGNLDGTMRTETINTHIHNITSSKSPVEINQAFTAAIVQRLCTLVALDRGTISLDSPLMSYGLDSLTAIELKNWFAQDLDTAIQASEILDAPSIVALATKAASRSKLVQIGSNENPEQDPKRGPNHNMVTGLSLPQLPLPDLSGTLELYYDSARSFLSKDKLDRTSNAVRLFQEGFGLQLQQRLLERTKDPQIENWEYDLHVSSIYLKAREPIHPYGIFYGSHQLTTIPHGQAERAAVISLAALEFMQRLNDGGLDQDHLNEEPLCMNSLQWLFNTSRKPFIDIDKVCKHKNEDYIVALRRGHLFKVILKQGGSNVSYNGLRTMFETVLDTSGDRRPAVATLTADMRQSWTELHKMIRSINKENNDLITLIEDAAFVVCLDDESPDSATQRCNQFLLGSPSNRWSDKTLQFVVCKNGVSAYICEHSMLDASSTKQLNTSVTKAIHAHVPDKTLQYNGSMHDGSLVGHNRSVDDTASDIGDMVKALHFEINQAISDHITRIQMHFDTTHNPIEFVHFRLSTFGNTFLRTRKMPPKTGYQLVIQLASLLYFGQQYPSWETITKMHFKKGRLDWMQVVSPAMLAFCKAAAGDDDVSLAQQRTLLREAAKVHTSTMARIARGKGFASHLECLKEVLRADEPMPALFTDPTWQMMRVNSPRKIKTDATEGLMTQEAGFLMPDPESVFVHYEVENDGCLYYVQSTKGRTKPFCDALQRAAEKVRALLDTDEI